MRGFISYRSLIAFLALALTGCGTLGAPTAATRLPARVAAHGATSVTPLRPAMIALVDRNFKAMAGGQPASVGAEALASYLGIGAAEAAKALKAMDYDKNGAVAHDELMLWSMRDAGLLALRDAVVAPAFVAADKSGDNRLSREEAAAATLSLGAEGAYALKIDAADFASVDFDKDGVLSEAEFTPLTGHKLALVLPKEADLAQRLTRFWFKAVSAG
jgi:hypothetical protein